MRVSYDVLMDDYWFVEFSDFLSVILSEVKELIDYDMNQSLFGLL